MESVETRWIGQNVDVNDLAVANREAEHSERSAVWAARHDADAAIYEDNLIGQANLRERCRLCGDGLGASNEPCCARELAAISPQHDVRIEHGDQPFEVALAGGSQERVDDAPLPVEVGVSLRGFALDATPRAARELTRSRGRAIDDWRDLVERHAEHVVQHECDPLRRFE